MFDTVVFSVLYYSIIRLHLIFMFQEFFTYMEYVGTLSSIFKNFMFFFSFLSKISCLSFQRKLCKRGGKHVFGLRLNWLIITFFEIKLAFFIWQEPKSSCYPLPTDSLSGNKFWRITADVQKQIYVSIKLKEYHIRF